MWDYWCKQVHAAHYRAPHMDFERIHFELRMLAIIMRLRDNSTYGVLG